jgi:hypothetical protein
LPSFVPRAAAPHGERGREAGKAEKSKKQKKQDRIHARTLGGAA